MLHSLQCKSIIRSGPIGPQCDMRIAVFNTLYYPNRKGGAEKSVQLICEEFVKKGVEVEVNSLWDGVAPKCQIHNGVKLRKWKNRNIYSIFDFDSKKIGFLKKIIWQIIDIFNVVMFFDSYFYFKKKKYDVLWTNNLSGFSLSIWVAAKLNRIKIVHTARDYYLISNNVMLFDDRNILPKHNIISAIKCRYLTFMSNLCDEFVGISNYILSLHATFLRGETKTIYNSIDKIDICSKRINKYKTYGYLGQINRAKGVHKLLEHFLCHSKNSRIIVAGKEDTELSSKYKDNKRVIFSGFVEPKCFFESIDCLIVPSIWNEPFGRVVIEALSHRCPVMVNSTGGLTELEGIFKSVYKLNLNVRVDYDSIEYDFCDEDLCIIKEKFSSNYISDRYLKLFEGLNE